MSNYLRQRQLRAAHTRRTPFMRPIRDQFELQLRGSFEAMRHAPNEGAFNALATVIDAVRLAIAARGMPAKPVLEIGAWTLIDVKRREPLVLLAYEEPLLLNAIEGMIETLKVISMEEFHAAMNSREGVEA